MCHLGIASEGGEGGVVERREQMVVVEFAKREERLYMWDGGGWGWGWVTHRRVSDGGA